MPKISELTAITSVTSDDLVMVVNDPSGSPSTNKITVGNFANTVTTQLRTANTTSSGVIKVGENLSSNSTGFLNVSGTAALPSSGRSEGFVVTWDAVTNAAIWQAFSGVRDLHLVDSANTYSVAEHDNVIFANPNNISEDIEIVLPDGTSTPAATTGKTYVIKNLNPGDGPYHVRVTTYSGKQSSSNILESPTTGNFVVYHDITAKGDEQGWIFDGAVWRHFGSQTGLPVFTGDANTFSELSIQNISSGADASADIVAYNNVGEPVTGDGPYVDMGINSSTYNNPDYSINGPSDSYLYNIGGDLTIGTANTGTSLILHAGGTTVDKTRMSINATGIYVNTSIIPTSNNTFSLGSPQKQWKDLYVSNNTIYIGNKPVTVTDSGALIVNGVDVSSGVSMLSPNIAYTGVFNGYPANIPVVKGQGIVFTSNSYVLETTNKYWWDGEFDTANYDLSGVETLNFYNLGGIKLDFRLGGKSENFLTSVNLRDIVAIQNNFYVRDLSALTTFSANNLSYIGNNFQIDTMDNANTQFNFPNLKTIINNFYYTYNDTLVNTPQFPALETVQNSIYMYYNSATQNTMTFDSLRYFGYGSIYQNDGMLAGPEFPALTSIDYFDMNNNDNMIDPPTFPVLETINGVFNFYGHAVVTSAPALPSLVTSNYIQINDNALMVNGFNFSSLVTVNGSINFDNNVSLTVSPTFPLLQTINGAFTIENNPLLTSGLSFPSLKTLVGNFSVNGCGFNETTINNLLVKLASLDGTNGTTSYDNSSIYLNGGTNAIPTGAGLAAKTTLEGRGCTVYVNS